MPIPRMYWVAALLMVTPLPITGCASLIGLEDLDKTKCTGACPDAEPDSRGGNSYSGKRGDAGRGGSGSGGSASGGGSGGALDVAGTSTAQTGGATNNAAAGGPSGGTTDGGTGTPANAGTTSGATPYSTGGADPDPTAGGPGAGGTEPGSGGLGGSAGAAGQPPSSGGAAAVTLPIRINFQPQGAAIPDGYVPDTGLTFATHDGLSFGWNVDHAALTRDRGVNSNQLLDTLCQFHQGGIWELALPNGTYRVLASVGDPSIQSIYTLLVEDVVYWRMSPVAANQFLSNTSMITVNDGRLTVSQGAAPELATHINYIEISAP